jgi:hypothetical protein
MNEPNPILEYVLPLLIAALVAALVFAMGMLGRWLAARGKASTTFAVVDRVWQVATSVVAHVGKGMANPIATAFADGKITPEEGARLKNQAMLLLKESVNTGELKRVLGLNDVGVDAFLSGKIEQALDVQKVVKASVGQPIIPRPL